MRVRHIEFLLEEPSMEAFLNQVLPRMLGNRITFSLHAYQGKTDLLGKLENRLRGYARWLPPDTRIVVLLDRDDSDCNALKARMEGAAQAAALRTRSTARTSDAVDWQVATRIAIEELEAWYFGCWNAVCHAYPRVKPGACRQAAYRLPDAIAGGTWEALELLLQRAGYHTGGLRKVEAANEIGRHFEHDACTSPSFARLRDVLRELRAVPRQPE
ncbi:DUF4276 family protein [Methylobacterium oxalidis]|uniref:DUF4276 family protein n=1 Tax=Methylobacterium oxalidis TaxID=944322 RepID=UPI003314864A